MKTRAINGKKLSKNLAEAMMDDFCKNKRVQERLEQGEFDFTGKRSLYNPDDAANDINDMKSSDYDDEIEERAWFPVYDAIDSASKKFPAFKRAKCGSDIGQNQFTTCFDDSGNLLVSVRYTMYDPLDSDFYKNQNKMLSQIAAGMPAGFSAYFMTEDDRGNSNDFIGTKRIIDKSEDRDSDETGVEIMIDYDVVETLVISKEDAINENEYNPDDAANDLNDMRSSDYEDEIEARTDNIEVDFPAWALDYVVNAEIGSLSRIEKQTVDKWIEMMDREGYDMNAVSYGEEEFFSSDPEFGLPCDCVTATIPKKNRLNESDDDTLSEEEFDPVARYLNI